MKLLMAIWAVLFRSANNFKNLSCWFKLASSTNYLSQCEQLYDSSPAWVLFFFKSPKIANFLPHCKHVNCSSAVWVLSCFSNNQKVQFFCHSMSSWMDLHPRELTLEWMLLYKDERGNGCSPNLTSLLSMLIAHLTLNKFVNFCLILWRSFVTFQKNVS